MSRVGPRPPRRSAAGFAGMAAALVLLAAPAEAAVPAPAPEITVTMFVDRVTVRAGGVVHYEVRVENVGDADAAHVRVTSHIPEHTTAASAHCPEGTLEPDGDICLQPEVATPGAGEPAHQIVHSRAPLPAGTGFSLRFAVSVDAGTAAGTLLTNHAHAADVAGEERTSAPVETLVVGAMPRGLFGDEALSMAGQSSTDGYDSSLAPYPASRQAGTGHVGSNGDVVLSGGALVDGDATPGPGHRAVLSGGALVTGTTEPAPVPIVLPDVHAAPYEATNDNGRICARPGDCENATYSDAEKSLSVDGTALLGPGAYYLCHLEVAGVLTTEGRVTIWMGSPAACGGSSTVRVSSGGAIRPLSGRPVDLHVRVEGDASGATAVTVTSRSSFEGVAYAPRSTAVLDGGAQFLGSLTAGTVVAAAGGAHVHLDRSLFED